MKVTIKMLNNAIIIVLGIFVMVSSYLLLTWSNDWFRDMLLLVWASLLSFDILIFIFVLHNHLQLYKLNNPDDNDYDDDTLRDQSQMR